MNPLEQAAIFRNTAEQAPRPRQEIAPKQLARTAIRELPRKQYQGVCMECLSRVCKHIAPEAPPPTLQPRHIRILNLLAQGLSNKEIASTLGYVDGTVKQYTWEIFRLLGLTSRLECALWARDHTDLLTEKTISA